MLAGRAVPGQSSVPYRPLTEATLQGLRDGPMPEDPDLAPWLPALSAVVPGLGARAGAADATAPVRAEALLQLWRRMAPAAGLLVVLEDLHWADPDTLAVVEYLADNLGEVPILLLVTLRDEPASPALDLVRRLRGRSRVWRLDLDRLDGDQVAAMVRACAPGATGEQTARVGRTAEGVPLLVEELLAVPGVPTSFTESVSERLSAFDRAGRRVLDAAAVLGRHFDWALLPAMTGLPVERVSDALAAAVGQFLLRVEAGTFRFRHALTREAVLDLMLPPSQLALAAAGLSAVEAAHPDLAGSWRDVAADLAARAGDRHRAGSLLADSGRAALRQGALATATTTLARALELRGGDEHAEISLPLVETLALAGRVDEAATAAARAVAALGDDVATDSRRAEIHLQVAQGAVAASRWALASAELTSARRLLDGRPPSEHSARLAVLDAELALAADDTGHARHRALDALAVQASGPDVRCQAHEVLGRIERLADLPAARASFQRALTIAAAADLELWRLRALHELGTIDMFEQLDAGRLVEARHSAQRLGALSTAAVLDLQLAALFISRWEPEQATRHAHSALRLAEQLRLGQVRGKSLVLLAESHALLAQVDRVEDCLAPIAAMAPADPSLAGFSWGARGEAALVAGDVRSALAQLERAADLLDRLPHAEPAAFRALWPLLLASVGDDRAAAAVADARRLGVTAFNLNRGLLGYADAVLAARAGRPTLATQLARAADRSLVNCEVWPDLARLLAADSALVAGWGEPHRWLRHAAETFRRRGLPSLMQRCHDLLGDPRSHLWSTFGVTRREADVLRLVATGLANKEIAGRLGVSARTVEKHVEALLRKTDTRSRTQLALLAGNSAEASTRISPGA